MFNTKILVFLLLLISPIFLIGCFPQDTSSLPCPETTRDEVVDTIGIESSFRVWLRPKSSNLIFKNSNGGVFSLSVEESYGEISDNNLKTIWATESCEPDIRLISKVEYDFIKYSGVEIPYDIQIRRELNLSYSEVLKYKDTVASKSEQINFRVGWEGFPYYLSDSGNSYQEEYQLLDSIYKQVYVCKNTRVKEGLYPTKFILQRGAGLIGFELSNKEVWAIK